MEVMMEKKRGIFGVIALALLLTLSACSSAPDTSAESSTEIEVDEIIPDDSWVPTGFTAWAQDTDVAYRYPGTQNCDDFNCVDIEFVSRYGCSDFYASANYLDGPDGNVIGYDNATLPSLQPLQKAKLKFEDTSNTSTHWQIAEIICR